VCTPSSIIVRHRASPLVIAKQHHPLTTIANVCDGAPPFDRHRSSLTIIMHPSRQRSCHAGCR
jgi:hypothetical protein